MAAPSSQQLLDAVNEALLVVMQSGQRVVLPTGAAFDRANLSELQTLRSTLEVQVAQEAGGAVAEFSITGLGGV